jgi:hypothetical protein
METLNNYFIQFSTVFDLGTLLCALPEARNALLKSWEYGAVKKNFYPVKPFEITKPQTKWSRTFFIKNLSAWKNRTGETWHVLDPAQTVS